jgi:hypothetical protein
MRCIFGHYGFFGYRPAPALRPLHYKATSLVASENLANTSENGMLLIYTQSHSPNSSAKTTYSTSKAALAGGFPRGIAWQTSHKQKTVSDKKKKAAHQQ